MVFIPHLYSSSSLLKKFPKKSRLVFLFSISSLVKLPLVIFGRVASMEITIVDSAEEKKKKVEKQKCLSTSIFRISTKSITKIMIDLTLIRIFALLGAFSLKRICFPDERQSFFCLLLFT